MQPSITEDPRGYLEKLSRKELEYTAKFYGIADVKQGMPAQLMRQLIAQANPPKIPIPIRQNIGTYAEPLRVPPYDIWKHTQFGQPKEAQPVQEISEVNAIDDLARQWEQESARPPMVEQVSDVPAKRIPKIVLLRRECKARGIKWERTDKAADLEAKLNGQDASERS